MGEESGPSFQIHHGLGGKKKPGLFQQSMDTVPICNNCSVGGMQKNTHSPNEGMVSKCRYAAGDVAA